MGPLELIDLIGVDIHLAKTETLYRELGDTRYRPNFLLRKMVRRATGPQDGPRFLHV